MPGNKDVPQSDATSSPTAAPVMSVEEQANARQSRLKAQLRETLATLQTEEERQAVQGLLGKFLAGEEYPEKRDPAEALFQVLGIDTAHQEASAAAQQFMAQQAPADRPAAAASTTATVTSPHGSTTAPPVADATRRAATITTPQPSDGVATNDPTRSTLQGRSPSSLPPPLQRNVAKPPPPLSHATHLQARSDVAHTPFGSMTAPRATTATHASALPPPLASATAQPLQDNGGTHPSGAATSMSHDASGTASSPRLSMPLDQTHQRPLSSRFESTGGPRRSVSQQSLGNLAREAAQRARASGRGQDDDTASLSDLTDGGVTWGYGAGSEHSDDTTLLLITTLRVFDSSPPSGNKTLQLFQDGTAVFLDAPGGNLELSSSRLYSPDHEDWFKLRQEQGIWYRIWEGRPDQQPVIEAFDSRLGWQYCEPSDLPSWHGEYDDFRRRSPLPAIPHDLIPGYLEQLAVFQAQDDSLNDAETKRQAYRDFLSAKPEQTAKQLAREWKEKVECAKVLLEVCRIYRERLGADEKAKQLYRVTEDFKRLHHAASRLMKDFLQLRQRLDFQHENFKRQAKAYGAYVPATALKAVITQHQKTVLAPPTPFLRAITPTFFRRTESLAEKHEKANARLQLALTQTETAWEAYDTEYKEVWHELEALEPTLREQSKTPHPEQQLHRVQLVDSFAIPTYETMTPDDIAPNPTGWGVSTDSEALKAHFQARYPNAEEADIASYVAKFMDGKPMEIRDPEKYETYVYHLYPNGFGWDEQAARRSLEVPARDDEGRSIMKKVSPDYQRLAPVQQQEYRYKKYLQMAGELVKNSGPVINVSGGFATNAQRAVVKEMAVAAAALVGYQNVILNTAALTQKERSRIAKDAKSFAKRYEHLINAVRGTLTVHLPFETELESVAPYSPALGG